MSIYAPYYINSLGLRDREYGPKKEGVFRILLLGDSFSVSHGLPIEESLSRQMEKTLQEIADKEGKTIKFEVVNGAVGDTPLIITGRRIIAGPHFSIPMQFFWVYLRMIMNVAKKI